ncbi:flagellar motor stator protein MotA [Niveispirillum irakense]|uniref:flagellar motor stator protein MotA n=1 Tax=Niveispirillum irakense TaxID=34011 RepID=UPI0003F75AF8|nr:flagellar motor stator protein MotA [Niveispirillum irakense]
MNLVLGTVIVFACVLGGFLALGGHLSVLWQPFEAIIIIGAALGAFVIANPWRIVRETGASLVLLFRGGKNRRDDYLELLALLYTVLRTVRTKGMLGLEKDIERPHESPLFQQFPRFLKQERAIRFLTDYLRLFSLGADRPAEMEALMDEELSTMNKEFHRAPRSLNMVAEALPALGIVAAVLGMIKAMGSISAPPEVLGKLIGGAMVGTFLGVMLSYGIVSPLVAALNRMRDDDIKYFHCIKAALVAHLHGAAPTISVEHARKMLYAEVQPTFNEVEDVTTNATQRMGERQQAA